MASFQAQDQPALTIITTAIAIAAVATTLPAFYLSSPVSRIAPSLASSLRHPHLLHRSLRLGLHFNLAQLCHLQPLLFHLH